MLDVVKEERAQAQRTRDDINLEFRMFRDDLGRVLDIAPKERPGCDLITAVELRVADLASARERGKEVDCGNSRWHDAERQLNQLKEDQVEFCQRIRQVLGVDPGNLGLDILAKIAAMRAETPTQEAMDVRERIEAAGFEFGDEDSNYDMVSELCKHIDNQERSLRIAIEHAAAKRPKPSKVDVALQEFEKLVGMKIENADAIAMDSYTLLTNEFTPNRFEGCITLRAWWPRS
jgi:hypothetical protein